MNIRLKQHWGFLSELCCQNTFDLVFHGEC
jgi:hypothetical protein